MHLRLPVALARAVIPLVGVLFALALLAAASVALVLGVFSSTTRWHLFFAGVNIYLASIVWGVWINGRPLPADAQGRPGR